MTDSPGQGIHDCTNNKFMFLKLWVTSVTRPTCKVDHGSQAAPQQRPALQVLRTGLMASASPITRSARCCQVATQTWQPVLNGTSKGFNLKRNLKTANQAYLRVDHGRGVALQQRHACTGALRQDSWPLRRPFQVSAVVKQPRWR
jgi:hypothetical protein